MLKKVTWITGIFLGVLSAGYPQLRNSFEITGKIGDLVEGEKVTLSYYPDSVNGQADFLVLLDSTYSKNGTFHFRGVVEDGPRLYLIRFEPPGPWIHYSRWIRLLIDNNQKILVKASSLAKINHGILDQHVTVEGSPSNEAWLKFGPVITMYNQNINRVKNNILNVADSLGFNQSMIKGLIMAKDAINTSLFFSFLLDLPDEFRPAILPAVDRFRLVEKSNYHFLWTQFYEKLDTVLKQTHYGRKLKAKLPFYVGESLPRTGLQIVGNACVSYLEVLKANKVTLVRFVNWDVSDRKIINDDLAGLVKRYRKDGFDFITVVPEKKCNAFCRAIESTLQMALVDRSGKIIGWFDNSSELHVAIKRMLKNTNAK